MGGQPVWGNAGDATNAYPVRANLEKELFYFADYKRIFGRMNGGRMVQTYKRQFGENTISIDAGNDSPVWQKPITNGNEVRFTLREKNKGSATFGEAPVADGDMGQFMHTNVFVRTVHSPAWPIPGIESQANISELITDFVKLEKDNGTVWGGEEMDLDSFRALLLGASRPLLNTTDGGLGMTLPGGSTGGIRSCYNTHVWGDLVRGALTTPNFTAATHEASIATALAALTDKAVNGYTYDCHKANAYLIDRLKFKPVKIGGKQYKAAALIDPRNIYRLQADTTLLGIWQNALARGQDNPAINHLNPIVLDDILYIPCQQLEWFRPAIAGSTVTYGAGLNSDPRLDSFTNSSTLTLTVFMGSGALLRAIRPKIWWTDFEGKHGQGANYALHYSDGVVRREWATKDGRSVLKNDSTLVCYNKDNGVGVSYAA